MMRENTVLALGGYGRAGKHIADLLLSNTEEMRVIIAGRNRSKAKQAVDKLNDHYPGHRAFPLILDAGNPSNLKAAFGLCRLVIVSMPYQNRDQAQAVLNAAVSAGIHYIDLNADAAKTRILKGLEQQIQAQNQIFLLGSGIIPGCPSVLARFAGEYFDSIRSVRLASSVVDPDIPYGGAFDLISHTKKPVLSYRAGRWRKVSPFSVKSLEFGDRFGKRLVAPVMLAELEDIPNLLGLDSLKMYQGGLNAWAGLLLLVWSGLKLARWKWGVQLGTRLFLWANRKFTRPPFGLELRMESVGVKNGQLERLTVSLRHEDVYLATAIPVVASVKAIFNGDICAPDSQYMDHAVNPIRFMEQLEQLGMKMEIGSIPIERHSPG